MSNVKWIKLSAQIFDDEKIRLLEKIPESDAVLIIWIKLLSQAGKTNAGGYVYLSKDIPYTDEMLSTIFGRPIATVKSALQILAQYKMIEISSNNMIFICNWEKHQNIEGLEKIRKQTRKRVAKHRELKSTRSVALPVTVCNGTELDEEKDKSNIKNNIYAKDFELFWSKYPRKIDKKKANKAFKAKMKIHSVETIISGTEKYAIQVRNRDMQFIKHPATFLSNESFVDGFEEVMLMKGLPDRWLKNMDLTSSYCNQHTYYKNGVEQVKDIRMLNYNGNEVCPLCETQKSTNQLQSDINQHYYDSNNNRKYNIFLKNSLFTDKTILTASFDSYIATTQEEKNNKSLCLEILKQLKEGLIFNVLLQGNQGAGKSHLAYSLLTELNACKDKTSLFVSVEEMIRKIKDSFNNRDSKYTEQYFIDLLSSVDYLVLDDIGAETGAIVTNKNATDFVQRILYAITNARQDKVTISTTNLDSKTLFSMYDKKLVSRLLRNPRYVLFKETKDKRILSLPF